MSVLTAFTVRKNTNLNRTEPKSGVSSEPRLNDISVNRDSPSAS